MMGFARMSEAACTPQCRNWYFPFNSMTVLFVALSAAGARDVNRRQLPTHHCDTVCDDEGADNFQAVCGTDGMLYKSRCDYNNALCKARESGTLLMYSSVGPECVTKATACDVMQHTTCIRLPLSLPATPGSPFVPGSPTTRKLVCGTDGNTYGSVCELMKKRCSDPASELAVDHDGQCELKLGNNSRMVNCSKYVVDLGGLALEGGSHVTLRVRPCEKILKPVCGIDGRTYSNECTFCGSLASRHIIQTGHLTVPIEHDGSCSIGGIVG